MQIGTKRISVDDFQLVTFRPATQDDDAFLLAVYGSTRTEELALTGWDQAQRDAFLKMQFKAQQIHYRQHYPEGEHLIILVNDRAAGRLYIASIEQQIRILDITVLPQHRSAGIGTAIIKELMAEAAAKRKPLCIYVESFNRSLRLFERLGFLKSGESGYSHLLEWRAQTA